MKVTANSKNGTAFFSLGAIALVGGLGIICYLIHEGYEPSIKFGGAELALKKNHDAKAETADDEPEVRKPMYNCRFP